MQEEIIFEYCGTTLAVQCKKEDKMKDICAKFKVKISSNEEFIFLYGGTKINLELKFEELIRNNNNRITVISSNPQPNQDNIVKSKKIICPRCHESTIIKIKDDFKIYLSGCNNGDKFEDLSINEFINSQNINLSLIVCNSCNDNNKGNVSKNQFYFCVDCKKNLCPLCNAKHDKGHKIINYDYKNYICLEDKFKFLRYCKDCKQNLCIKCTSKHQNHRLYEFSSIDIKLEEIKKSIDNITKYIDNQIAIYNNVKENLNKLYQIYSDIYAIDADNLNYQDLQSLQQEIYFPTEVDNESIVNLYNKFNPVNTENRNDIIKIIYKPQKNEIRIFDKDFIANNNQCKMIINGRLYDLQEKWKTKEDYLTVELTNIHSITNASKMFFDCSKLIELPDIKKWNTNKVTNMSNMFSGCCLLKELPDISNWDTTNVTDISFMFYNCSLLTELPDISIWNISKVTNMKSLFGGCSSLTELPELSKWNISNVTDIGGIFCGCVNLEKIPNISSWKTGKITNMFSLFNGCSKLKEIPDISSWDTTNLTQMSGLFNGCLSLVKIPDISKWEVNNVKNMSCMFNACKSLEKLPDISIWNTMNVSQMSHMFYKCSKLKKLPDISKWNINKVEKKDNMFDGCPENLNIIIEKFQNRRT